MSDLRSRPNGTYIFDAYADVNNVIDEVNAIRNIDEVKFDADKSLITLVFYNCI